MKTNTLSALAMALTASLTSGAVAFAADAGKDHKPRHHEEKKKAEKEKREVKRDEKKLKRDKERLAHDRKALKAGHKHA